MPRPPSYSLILTHPDSSVSYFHTQLPHCCWIVYRALQDTFPDSPLNLIKHTGSGPQALTSEELFRLGMGASLHA